MFGPAFLVSPIVQPMENITVAPDAIRQWNLTGSKTKSVYLPDALWYDFWTGEQIHGGATITTPVTIEKMPLHVKAGSIVPMGPVVQYASEPFDSPVELRIYPGADGSFTLYEDDGKTYNYEKKAHATFTFSWDDHNSSLSISERVGEFDGMKKSWKFNIVLVRPGHGVGIGEEEHPDKSIVYEGQPQKVSFR
jgi:alpha-D-xyloside xylohydrolase